VFVGALAARLFGPRAGAAAGWLSAGYPPLVFYASLFCTETLFVFLLCLWALLWFLAEGRRNSALWIACGFVFGLACLTRSSLAGFLPVAALAVWGRTGRRGWAPCLLLCLGAGLPLGAWAVRNYGIHRAWVPLTTESGYTLWAANREGTTGGGECPLPPRETWPRFAGKSEVERDREFRRMGWEAVAHRSTGEQALLMARKVARFWRPWPHGEHVGRAAAVMSGVSFVPLFLAAAAGAWMTRARWRDLGILYLLAVYFTVVHMVFMAVMRYRLPIEAFLLVLAGAVVARIVAPSGERARA
jgi:4-amino-4-deoxy-L-arabinose transferase-like glycosyltransferase